jgi:hypothetical protein
MGATGIEASKKQEALYSRGMKVKVKLSLLTGRGGP